MAGRALLLASAVACASAAFVTRNGSQLLLNSAPFRFSGANMYWLGLDENVGGIAYPSHYRISDALQTAAGMGITVVRSHSIGISTGNPLSFEPSLGVFNATALDAADFAVATARQLGIKLIVPLTDEYAYYHGGYHDFTDWLGLPKSVFFTDPRAIAAFCDYITARLTHVNPYTGLSYAEDDTILAWETGNELQPPSNASWTAVIAAHLKSLAPQTLVLDGAYGVQPAALTVSDVDLVSDHFYPVNAARMAAGAAMTAVAAKVYIGGEYGWTSGDVPGFIAAALGNGNVSGVAFWSFFPHLDTYGFEQHSDGFTVHFPGDNVAMQSAVAMFHSAAAAFAGVSPAPAYAAPASQPVITLAAGNKVAWRGVALAANYTVQISTSGSNGPWSTVCSACVSDNGTPYPVSLPVGAWVQVQPVGPAGATGPWSAPVQAS